MIEFPPLRILPQPASVSPSNFETPPQNGPIQSQWYSSYQRLSGTACNFATASLTVPLLMQNTSGITTLLFTSALAATWLLPPHPSRWPFPPPHMTRILELQEGLTISEEFPFLIKKEGHCWFVHKRTGRQERVWVCKVDPQTGRISDPPMEAGERSLWRPATWSCSNRVEVHHGDKIVFQKGAMTPIAVPVWDSLRYPPPNQRESPPYRQQREREQQKIMGFDKSTGQLLYYQLMIESPNPTDIVPQQLAREFEISTLAIRGNQVHLTLHFPQEWANRENPLSLTLSYEQARENGLVHNRTVSVFLPMLKLMPTQFIFRTEEDIPVKLECFFDLDSIPMDSLCVHAESCVIEYGTVLVTFYVRIPETPHESNRIKIRMPIQDAIEFRIITRELTESLGIDSRSFELTNLSTRPLEELVFKRFPTGIHTIRHPVRLNDLLLQSPSGRIEIYKGGQGFTESTWPYPVFAFDDPSLDMTLVAKIYFQDGNLMLSSSLPISIRQLGHPLQVENSNPINLFSFNEITLLGLGPLQFTKRSFSDNIWDIVASNLRLKIS